MINSQGPIGNARRDIPKMKKDAFSLVDKQKEREQDPKYKTELCKSFSIKQFCIYGNKCRFAHGKNDLFKKSVESNIKYKQKKCKSFFDNKFCLYGLRCHFKHNETNLKELDRSHYYYLLNKLVSRFRNTATYNYNHSKEIRVDSKRLKVFNEIVLEDETADNSIEYTSNNSEVKIRENSNSDHKSIFSNRNFLYCYLNNKDILVEI